MPLTPEQYADQFTAALQTYIADSDEEAFSDAYAAIWTNAVTGGTSIAQIGAEFSAAVGAWFTNQEQMASWLTGSAVEVIVDPPGQPQPGWFPLTNNINVLVWVPSPALMVSTIAKGDPGGVTFEYASAMADGKIVFNNANPALVTSIQISQEDSNSHDITAWLNSLGVSSSTVKGTLYFQEGAIGPLAIYQLTGVPVDSGEFFTLPVTYVTHSGAFTENLSITVNISPTGDAGTMLKAGVGEPDPGFGILDDFYLRLDTGDYYGPKTVAGWGDPIPQTEVASLLAQTIAARDAAADSEAAASTSANNADTSEANSAASAAAALASANNAAASEDNALGYRDTAGSYANDTEADRLATSADRAAVATDKATTEGFKDAAGVSAGQAATSAAAAAASAASVNADEIIARQWFYM